MCQLLDFKKRKAKKRKIKELGTVPLCGKLDMRLRGYRSPPAPFASVSQSLPTAAPQLAFPPCLPAFLPAVSPGDCSVLVYVNLSLFLVAAQHSLVGMNQRFV